MCSLCLSLSVHGCGGVYFPSGSRRLLLLLPHDNTTSTVNTASPLQIPNCLHLLKHFFVGGVFFAAFQLPRLDGQPVILARYSEWCNEEEERLRRESEELERDQKQLDLETKT